ncbi:MAG: hypothetical protein U0X93_15820 [Anaerolineales bacterium]
MASSPPLARKPARANAITFGRIDREESLVSQLSVWICGVKHLGELNTLPRVTYLKEG